MIMLTIYPQAYPMSMKYEHGHNNNEDLPETNEPSSYRKNILALKNSYVTAS